MLGTAVYAFGLHYFIIPESINGRRRDRDCHLAQLRIRLAFIHLNLSVEYSALFIVGWRILRTNTDRLYHIRHRLVVRVSCTHGETDRSGVDCPISNFERLHIGCLIRWCHVRHRAWYCVPVRRYDRRGADIIARIASKMKGWSMGQVILTLDVVIIGASLIYIPKEKVLYTLVAVFIASKMIDFIQEGAYSAKAFSIFTENAERRQCK